MGWLLKATIHLSMTYEEIHFYLAHAHAPTDTHILVAVQYIIRIKYLLGATLMPGLQVYHKGFYSGWVVGVIMICVCEC